MAIKAGQILHDAHGFVIDRIQTGGVSNLNIPEEKIYELGNYQTVATVRDIPDLSFELESFDVSTEIEALLTNTNPATVSTGQEFSFSNTVPLDIISPFKSGNGAFDIVKGVAVPYLNLESATYRFGVRQNSTQAFSLRGDSVYYIPGTPYWENKTVITGANQTYTFDRTAVIYTEGGNSLYALSVCAKNPVTKTYKRLFFGSDYTNTATTVTILPNLFTQGYTDLHVVYGSLTAATYAQAVHQTTSVKPAAVRGKDIDVYVGTNAATPVFTRWGGVQSFEVSRRTNLENDEEFGNYHFVASDYDVAEVSGSITIKPANTTDLFDKIAQVANVATNVVVGTQTSVALPVELRVNDPDTGTRLKTLYVPDARFTVPNVQGRVQQKLTVNFNFSSDGGTLKVYKGAR